MKSKKIPPVLQNLYSRLDLFYRHYTDERSLVSENTGEIDFGAFLDTPDGRFWVDWQSDTEEKKKVLVFNSGYFRYLRSEMQKQLAIFLEELSCHGFEIYIPFASPEPVACSSTESRLRAPLTLKRLSNGALDLINLTPVHSPRAIELAAGINIPKDRVKLINNLFLGQLVGALSQLTPESLFEPFPWLPLFPEKVLPDQDALIAMLEPEDGLSLNRQHWIRGDAYQLQPALIDRVKSVVYDHSSSVDYRELFPSFFDGSLSAIQRYTFEQYEKLEVHKLQLRSDGLHQNKSNQEKSQVVSLKADLNFYHIDDCAPVLDEIRRYTNVTRAEVSCFSVTRPVLADVLKALPDIIHLTLSCEPFKQDSGAAEFYLEPGSLPHLTSLTLTNTTLLPRDFEILLKAAPGLSFLCLNELPFLYGLNEKAQELPLGRLIDLNCHYARFESLDKVLAATPNLQSLVISGGEDTGTGLTSTLAHLKYLEVDRLPVNLIAQLLRTAPFLTSASLNRTDRGFVSPLTLSRYRYTLDNLYCLLVNSNQDAPSLIAWFKKAPQLRTIVSYLLEITGELIQQQRAKYQPLQRLVSSVACLKLLNIRSDTDLSWLGSHLSPAVKSLDIVKSTLSAQQLQTILGAFPNLHNLFFSNVRFEAQTLKLRQNSLKGLRAFNWRNTYPALDMEPQLILALLHAAPGIEIVDLGSCVSYAELMNSLKRLYPNVRFKHHVVTGPHHSGHGASSLKPDGQLKRTGKETHITSSMFINHQHVSPPAHNYHLHSYAWSAALEGFIPYPVPARNLTQLKDSSHSLTSLLRAWERDEAFQPRDCFLGKLDGFTLLPGQIVRLPALSHGDRVMEYACNVPGITLWRDGLLGYHYIQSETIQFSSTLIYIIKEGKAAVAGKSSARLPFGTLRLISELVFECGELKRSEAYEQLRKRPARQLVQALTEFCRFPNHDGDDFSPADTSALLNHLLLTRTGSCRHRAWLFTALASGFGLQAFYNSNDCHSFGVWVGEDGPQSIDLGGAPAIVKTLPFVMPATSPEYTPESDETSQPAQSTQASSPAEPVPLAAPVTPRYCIPTEWDDYFTLWNNCPLSVTSPEELASDMIYHHQEIRRHLLILPHSAAIERFNQTVLSLIDAPAFFTPYLDDLQLTGNRITDDGRLVPADSALGLFIKRAQAEPESSFVWFINFSDNRPEHIIYNQLFDNEGRRLGSVFLPDNLRLVMVLDKLSALQLAEDMLSRMDRISSPEQLIWPELAKPDLCSRPIGPGDVLVVSADNWKDEIAGRILPCDDGFVWRAGPLLKLQENDTLTLHNAPWHQREFRQFMYTLQASARFFANGQWHALSRGASVQLARPQFEQEPVLPLTDLIADEFPLNSRTWRALLPHTGINPQTGFIINHPGLLAQMPLRLIVTEALDAAIGYAVSQQARALSCPLQIQPLPGITLPETLKAFRVSEQPLTLSDNIRVILCPDLDFALDGLAGHSIAVDEKTRFDSLFLNVKREGMRLVSCETDLARAIRHGEPVILHGQFSSEFIRRAQTLFVNPPHVFINGERIMAQGSITLVSDDPVRWSNIPSQTLEYNPELDFERLPQPERAARKALYQTLARTPCHSHFQNIPDIMQGLRLSAGQPIKSEPDTLPLSPEGLLAAFERQPCLFLIGQSGTGKSELFLRGLPAWAGEQHVDLKIHHGPEALMDWIHQDTGIAIWFDDEANCKNQSYHFLYHMLRGEFVIWLNGMRYQLDPQRHRVGLAGNFLGFEGRVEVDLFRRFPHYLEVRPSLPILDRLLMPLLGHFSDAASQLDLIKSCHQRALNAGLIMTSRNAMMICIQAFALKHQPCLQGFSDEMLIRYAISLELRGLYKKTAAGKVFIHELKQDTQSLQERLHALPLPDLGGDFTWTPIHRKIAHTLRRLILVREKKEAGEVSQHQGINGLLLEGPPGVFKTQLLRRLLTAWAIPFVEIDTSDRTIRREQLVAGWRGGMFMLIDELNGLDEEFLLNTLLSGTDPDGNPPDKPGAFFLATQNPVSTSNRLPLSDALANRLSVVVLKPYRTEHLRQIAEHTHQLSEKAAYWLTERYQQKKAEAVYRGLLRPTDRLFFKAAADVRRNHGAHMSELDAVLPAIPQASAPEDTNQPAVERNRDSRGAERKCHLM
ncbi:hypothetical protein [Legionella sp. CNM-4043-24]|uniref:hypothetical protein n=1 Tax=Legionella sp. CNM-4043-24 TaxID=3421646 RepID=UPI00403A9AD4